MIYSTGKIADKERVQPMLTKDIFKAKADNTVDSVIEAFKQVLPQGLNAENTVFVCIGTDRSTGDCLGPLAGTDLEALGYTVFGTLSNPVHGVSIWDRMEELDEYLDRTSQHKTVIAIDACLGKTSSVGKIIISQGPMKPGAGVQKELPSVGDYHIAPIVNVGGYMEYFILQNTSLATVIQLKDCVVEAIQRVIPIPIRETTPAPMLNKISKNQVKAAIRKKGKWAGYLAGNKVNEYHINNGWALGVWVEVASIEELENTLSNFLCYMSPELGTRAAYFSI